MDQKDKLSRERAEKLRYRAALEASRDMYPRDTVCAICGSIWLAHRGELCPAVGGREKQMELLPRVLRGELPKEALMFQWGGTYFLPLLEGGNRGEVMVTV